MSTLQCGQRINGREVINKSSPGQSAHGQRRINGPGAAGGGDVARRRLCAGREDPKSQMSFLQQESL
jgi:hypothetical protein